MKIATDVFDFQIMFSLVVLFFYITAVATVFIPLVASKFNRLSRRPGARVFLDFSRRPAV